jgi:photosystem II stability/assembly factor-like uncharacterized protein
MSQNHHLPSPDCAAFAPLLPLAGHDLLSAPEDARLRAHLATCAHCRAALSVYDQVELALRRGVGSRQGTRPPFSREELMQTFDHQTDHSIIEYSAPSAPPIVPTTPQRRPRRFLRGLPALAATLVIMLLAVTIFGITRLLPTQPANTPRLVDLRNTALLSISMISSAEGWAVGTTNGNDAQGVILHYHQGRWWQVANPYDTGELRSVFMLSASDGWIVGDKGTILHYTGGKWVKVKSPVSTALGSVYMSSSDEGWAMGQDILQYDRGDWSVVNGPKHGFIFSVEDSSLTGGWAVGGGGTVLQYTGGQWQAVPAPKIDLYSVAMIASNVGWAVGSGGSAGNLLYYQNGTWSVVNNPASQETLWSIAMPSPDEGWAVGSTHSDTGLLLHYSRGQWTEVPSPTNEFLLAVALTSPAEGWAVGSHGVILHYLNGVWSVYTQTVAPDSTPTPPAGGLDLSKYELHDISMVSPDEGWAVGNTWSIISQGSNPYRMDAGDPVILHYLHGRWTPDPLPDVTRQLNCGGSNGACPPFALYSITMTSAREGWAVGSSVLPPGADGITFPLLLHYTGGKWVEVDLQNAALSSIYLRSANDGWAIGQVFAANGVGSAEIFHYDGHNWTPVFNPGTFSVAPGGIFGAPGGNLWVTGIDTSVTVGDGEDGNDHIALLHYDGTRWSKVDPHIANGRLYSFAFTSAEDGWAVGMLPNTDQHRPSEVDGLLMRYHNGVWEQQPLLKDPFGSSSFSLNGVAMLSPQEGWAVGNEGVMLHYVNGVWERAPSPTSEDLLLVTFASASEGWAIGANGTMLHYQYGAWSVYQN